MTSDYRSNSVYQTHNVNISNVFNTSGFGGTVDWDAPHVVNFGTDNTSKYRISFPEPKKKRAVCEYCGRKNKRKVELCKSCGAPL